MEFKDQLGRQIVLDSVPVRIISLVPSQTELLHDLGLDEQVVGITKFCIHPDSWYRTKERVGGTKNLDLDKIRTLKPDLIIANKEENEESQINELAEDHSVWVSDINTVGSALEMVAEVGKMTDSVDSAQALVSNVKQSLVSDSREIGSAVYLIWNDPMMVAGSDTFISEMMSRAGFQNLIAGPRYPEMSDEEVTELQPEFILLSSEPFPFGNDHLQSFQKRFPKSKVALVDGEMFSWYGSRMLKAAEYFRELNRLIG